MKKNLLAITVCLCLLLAACGETHTGTGASQPSERENSAETTAAAEISEIKSEEAVSDTASTENAEERTPANPVWDACKSGCIIKQNSYDTHSALGTSPNALFSPF